MIACHNLTWSSSVGIGRLLCTCILGSRLLCQCHPPPPHPYNSPTVRRLDQGPHLHFPTLLHSTLTHPTPTSPTHGHTTAHALACLTRPSSRLSISRRSSCRAAEMQGSRVAKMQKREWAPAGRARGWHCQASRPAPWPGGKQGGAAVCSTALQQPTFVQRSWQALAPAVHMCGATPVQSICSPQPAPSGINLEAVAVQRRGRGQGAGSGVVRWSAPAACRGPQCNTPLVVCPPMCQPKPAAQGVQGPPHTQQPRGARLPEGGLPGSAATDLRPCRGARTLHALQFLLQGRIPAPCR